MKTSDFDFELPENLIAQKPLTPRDSSRLLVCQAKGRLGQFNGNFEFTHSHFSSLTDLLTENDLLIVNNAKVLPVRILGKSINGGAVEAVVMQSAASDEIQAIVKMSAKVLPGVKVFFEPGLVLEVVSVHEERIAAQGQTRFRFSGPEIERLRKETPIPFERWLELYGHVPLPPYIDRADDSNDRHVYQTVYAENTGSAAAPTAGFHFTDDLLAKLRAKGVQITTVTLHVGIGTFRPMRAENIEDHSMHEEFFEISPEFVETFKKAKAAGKRIVAVGTTTVRTLENWDQKTAGIFSTRAFIKPGYEFKVVDDLITNFHLPKSTLIVLVAAAMGLENEKAAYRHAIDGSYRFFSYGDAMLIRGN